MARKKVKKNKKLIIEHYSSDQNTMNLPRQYSLSRHVWQCQIIVKFTEHTDAFYIDAKDRIFLSEMFQIALDTLRNEVPNTAIDCGFKIYRCG